MKNPGGAGVSCINAVLTNGQVLHRINHVLTNGQDLP